MASAGARPCSDARQLRRERHGAERRGRLVLARVQVAIEPAVVRALHARRRRLHVVLRVEVRARRVGRAAGVDDRELPRVEERLERRQPRMQAEEAVEIDRRARSRPGRADRDARARLVVVALAERHDHVQSVDGAALEDRDQHPPARLRRRRRCARGTPARSRG